MLYYALYVMLLCYCAQHCELYSKSYAMLCNCMQGYSMLLYAMLLYAALRYTVHCAQHAAAGPAPHCPLSAPPPVIYCCCSKCLPCSLTYELHLPPCSSPRYEGGTGPLLVHPQSPRPPPLPPSLFTLLASCPLLTTSSAPHPLPFNLSALPLVLPVSSSSSSVPIDSIPTSPPSPPPSLTQGTPLLP